MNPVGDELRRWCKAHGMTQSACAMKLGVSASHLNQIINGRVRPSSDLVRRIRDHMSKLRPALLTAERASPRSPARSKARDAASAGIASVPRRR